ncbi:glycerol-3-phosphate 1-O-acyltransferase PlsY [Tabrizicola sp.]|jgi:acyl phosphate:glycerol-3-phosphate acyltransferase|uniref:glycerol-3-phosphate 1-O-acyltransferase PlsY n=1 Tax=Tabrizicola sp. TaxID=2005166 RepID=UPI0025D6A9A4|nr:glycerol-3-phosphate 1-O-acyltransferase PlsY [Tabrizicola sp.]MBY0351948.1 glycerol-3-phosphate 1-O-acyltransferase PlsY [Tabrizicola sp.]
MPLLATDLTPMLVTAVLAYLLGAVPFGIIVTRAMGLGDLRRIGSGNIGATNVLRTGNRGAALATLLLDGGKGAVAVLLARWLVGEDAAQLAGLSAFLGHLYPVWLGFKGGKGVATFLGVLLALSWMAGLAVCLTWLLTAVLTRTSSIAALVAAASAGLWIVLLTDGSPLILALILTVLIYVRHSANLKRIKAGTEPKIGAKSA